METSTQVPIDSAAMLQEIAAFRKRLAGWLCSSDNRPGATVGAQMHHLDQAKVADWYHIRRIGKALGKGIRQGGVIENHSAPQETPEWLQTPAPTTYELTMYDSAGCSLQKVELSREEYIAFKQDLATLRRNETS